MSELGELTEQLVRQQAALCGSEVRQEVRKVGHAALTFTGAAGLLGASSVLSTLSLVHLLRRSTGLPLWSCYALVAGMAGATGVGLLAAGQKQARAVRLTALPETVAGLQENLAWFKEQLRALAD